jgi:hypothetical protein
VTGLLLLAIAGLWLLVVLWLSKVAARRFSTGITRFAAGAVTFLLMAPIPLVDELIGGYQFRKLCDESSKFHVEVASPAGRVTRYSANPLHSPLPGTAIPILHSKIVYTDVSTGERVVSFNRYSAKGGVFIRALGISEGDSPITIGAPFCSPERANGEVVSRTLKFTVVN